MYNFRKPLMPILPTLSSSSYFGQTRHSLFLTGLGSHGDFRNLLVPGMPLRSLQVWTGLHRTQEGPWHLPHTFTFLADCFTHQLGTYHSANQHSDLSVSHPGWMSMSGQSEQSPFVQEYVSLETRGWETTPLPWTQFFLCFPENLAK